MRHPEVGKCSDYRHPEALAEGSITNVITPHLEIKDFGPPTRGGHEYACHPEQSEGTTHVDTPPILAKAGFTLAEVLITLGIIGVVAAMTIPNLISKIQKSKVETQVKHTYATFAQVIKSAEVDYGEVSGWGFDTVASELNSSGGDSDYNFLTTYILPYMSGAVITEFKVPLGEFGYKEGIKNPKTNLAHSLFAPTKSYYVITMKNGVIMLPSISSSSKSNSIIYAMTFVFDINGFSGPNTLGKDVFAMQIIPSTGGVEFAGETKNFNNVTGLPREKGTRSSILSSCKSNGTSCGALIKWDGWKISGDYPWIK